MKLHKVTLVIAVLATTLPAVTGVTGVNSMSAQAEADVLSQAEDVTDTGSWLRARGDGRIQQIAGRLEGLAASLGPERFGGSYWTEGGELVVQVVGTGEDDQLTPAHTWASGIADTVVQVKSKQFSYRALEVIAAEIPTMLDQLAARGQLESVWINVPENKVEVSLLKESFGEITELLALRYGDAVEVRVSEGLKPRAAANRRQDNSPFFGALSINQFSTENFGHNSHCTSGYAWRLWSTGQVVESTAGHCWARGTAVFNAQTAIGTVTHRAFANGGPTDAEFITPAAGSTFAPRIWVGGRSTSVSWPVVGAIDETTAHIGSPIVISGSNGGETRGTVSAVNATFCFSDGTCTTGMTRIQVTSGGVVNGDSGGPCFSSAGGQPSTVMARGQVVGPQAEPGETTYCTSVFDISATLEASILMQ